MTKIVLVCNAGISNTILLKHMQEEVENKEGNFEITSSSISEVDSKILNADVVLLSPQVAFERESIAKKVSVPVEVVSTEAYANLDALAIVEYAIKLAKR